MNHEGGGAKSELHAHLVRPGIPLRHQGASRATCVRWDNVCLPDFVFNLAIRTYKLPQRAADARVTVNGSVPY